MFLFFCCRTILHKLYKQTISSVSMIENELGAPQDVSSYKITPYLRKDNVLIINPDILALTPNEIPLDDVFGLAETIVP